MITDNLIDVIEAEITTNPHITLGDDSEPLNENDTNVSHGIYEDTAATTKIEQGRIQYEITVPSNSSIDGRDITELGISIVIGE